MATIEYIKKRITGKEKEITKLEKKMERINKAKATNWKVNPYYYDEHDLNRTDRDLKQAKMALDTLLADLDAAQEKADSRNVQVIIDFLANWKEKTREFYQRMYPEYLKAKAEKREADNEYYDWRRNCRFNLRKEGKHDEVKRIEAEHDMADRAFHREWGWIQTYVDYKGLDMDRLNKDLDKDADAKYDMIIEKTNAIVGTITDAENLKIGNTGELNGYIVGTRGTAKVQTIGAGGYNIQRFHFRTLIHAMR